MDSVKKQDHVGGRVFYHRIDDVILDGSTDTSARSLQNWTKVLVLVALVEFPHSVNA